MFKAKIEGLNAVLKKIEQYNKALAEGVDLELNEAAINIANNARILAPKGKTKELANSIGFDISKKYNKSVFVDASYAAFVEFGTGSRVFDAPFQFTPEMKDYAREFFVSGKGKMPARPYLFPSYTKELIQIRTRLKRLFFS